VITAALLGAAVLYLSLTHVRAQSPPPPLRLRMNAATVAAFEQARRMRLPYMPNQAVVKFREGVNRGGQQRALMALRSRPSVDELAWAGPVAVVTDLGQPNPMILAQQLREQPEVEYAEPNFIYQTTATPNDPGYAPRQWNFAALDMPRAWDINPGASSSLIVGILDTGVTTTTANYTFKTWNGSDIVDVSVPFATNPDMAASRLVSPFDFAFSAGATVLDMDGHGTHVASTVGEDTNNAIMAAGIAYNVRIMPVKVCIGYWEIQFMRSANGIPGYSPLSDDGGCLNDAISAGIRYAADNGAKVINISISGPAYSATMESAVQYAVSKGVFIAMAAGNNFEEGNPTNHPAKHGETINGAMAVGAVGRTLKRAYYSSSGSHVEITAPGGDIRDDPALGYIWQSMIRQSDSDPRSVIFPRFDRYNEIGIQGTSMASPHVAGVAALLMSQLGPAATPALIEEIIEATARACDASSCDPSAPRVGSLGRNHTFGHGLIQPRTALFGRGLRK
jgi:subtilisin family serine protease